MAKKRQYDVEYREFHGKPEQIKMRAARNKARAEAVKDGRIEKGSDKEINHKKPLSRGGSNAKSNQEVTTRTENRKQADKLKSEIKPAKKAAPKKGKK
jgi:5-methylcytosine-specific restriction endonuclease McrA